MGRILVLLVGIAIIVLVILMMFKGPGLGPGSGEGSGAGPGGLENAAVVEGSAAATARFELLVEGSGIFVDDAPAGSVTAAIAAAQSASSAGRSITLVIPGSASAATVTLLRDALDAAHLTYSVSTGH